MSKLIYTRFTKLIIDHFLSCNKSIPRRSDSKLHSEGRDLPLTKLINTVDCKYKFGMEIPESMITDAINRRGKCYMHLGDQEVNVPKAFQKNDVLIKSRSITFADNLLEIVNGAVLLAKSVSTKEQHCQQCDIMTQTTIERQIDKDVKDTYAKWRQKLKDISATDSDATQDSSHSDTNKEKEDETVDSDDFDMDLTNDESKGDDDVAGFVVFIYNKSTEPLKSTCLSPIVTSSSLEYIQSLLNETPM
ncbi:hypothetical protein Tco_0842858 [Tanacetum coccineum]|uniref:Uncharacterized protein n=1 Tax=Tanacetum coccineum TaxID=301880 RepID=A0ABQ5B1B7_9ASTR